MRSAASRHNKKPFAQQLGLFYRAPLAAVPLVAAVVAALAQAWLAAGRVGLIAGVLLLVLQVVVLRYGLSLLNRFALGSFDLSAHIADEHRNPYTVYKVLAGLAVMLTVGTLLAIAVPPLAWVFGVAMVAAAPAVVMRTTAYDSLQDGLSVPGALQLVGVMRGGYAWLLGMCLLVLFGSGLTARGLALIGGGGFLSQAIAAAVSNYALFVAFCMMGYGLFEHSDRLGLETRDERNARLTGGRAGPARTESAEELLSRGDVDAAFEAARDEARIATNEPKVQERYFKLLQMKGSDDKLPLQAARWLKACVLAERAQDCARVVEQWWVKDPTMLDDEPQTLLAAARLASRAGLIDEPLQMVRHFRATQVGSMLLPRALLFEADHLMSRLRDPVAAKVTLLELVERFPQSEPEVREARATLTVIERVEERAGKPGAA